MKKYSFLMVLFLVGLFSHQAFAQDEHTVTGTVTSANTEVTLPGVNVVLKGTTRGTTTNANGRYQLSVPSPDDTLIFSFVGYEKQVIPINGRTQIDVTMQIDVVSGQELVVIGYGEVQKRDLTGAVSSIDAEEFNRGVQVSVGQVLQGRAAGVQITRHNGRPGGGVSIRIRGTTSITAGNEPLYVVDGLPGAPINALNPGDIASIEILKDASATAIYGARGANGVILITTKQGQAGEMQITYDGSAGIQQIATTLDLLNTQEYIKLLNGIRADRGQDPIFTPEEIEAIGSGTDWQEEIFRTAPVQNHQLSFSGGSEETQYYISLNYLNQKGIIINTGIKRYGARINVNHSTEKFNFGLHLNTSLVHDMLVDSRGINAGAGVLASAIQMPPIVPVRNEEGSYAESQFVDLMNPVALANTIYQDRKTNRTFGNIFMEYEFLENLRAKINFGSNRRTSRFDSYTSDATRRGRGINGGANINAGENSSILLGLTLHYKETFNQVHQVDAVAGYTYQEFVDRGFSAGAQDFPTDAFRTNNLGAGSQEDYTVGSGKSKHQLLSWLGRINYSYLDKYLVTASFRIDGSSRFGEDHKYGYFPSLALGWRLSDEPFISELNIFSNLKLRVSYGITGNQAIGNYNALALLGTTGDAVFNDQRFVGIAPVQLENPDLKWETTKQFNVGLDYGFLEGRLSGTINYFVKNTSDLLLRLPVPRTTGFSSSLVNVGDTKNSGFEFLLNSQNITGNFSWSTSFNFSTLNNKVTDLGGLPFILQGGVRFLGNLTILKEGKPINSYYGYEVAGIFQSQQAIDESAQPFASPGDLRYVDQITVDTDGDGVADAPDGIIDSDDRTILGDPLPDMFFGLKNSFFYKGFGLNIFITGSYGQDMLNATRIDSENPISFRRNRQAYVLNRWMPEDPSHKNPSFVNPNISRAVNSRVVEDASYIRLQNINLSYNFPNLSIKGIRGISVYGTIQNLVTITDYSGYNPEVSTFGDSNVKIDYNAYPLATIYTAGINIKF